MGEINMHRNKDLYHYLVENSWQMSEDWYSMVEDNDPNSVYSTNDPAIIQTLKEQNQDYFQHLHELFVSEEGAFFHKFQQWSEELARDQKHLDTPIHNVVREFMRTEEVYTTYLKRFYFLHKDTINIEQVFKWIELVKKVVDLSIYIYMDEAHKNTLRQLSAQKELINELSSPVIKLQNKTALLPLIGDIDTARAKLIIENTLTQCAEKDIEHLCIDLSGVVIIDTMVAHEIFNLINSLDLLGVKSTLSGIRPEIAQTAVQLGLNFGNIHTTASLAHALDQIEK
jgi:rsbT co-antagonist protein RsbR